MAIKSYVYLIDLNELQRLRGSNRRDLCKDIEVKFEREHRFEDDDPIYRSPGEPSVRQAIGQFFDGSAFNVLYGNVYGNALWLLCRHFGTEIEEYYNSDTDAPYRASMVLKARFRVSDKVWCKTLADFPNFANFFEPSLNFLRLDAAQDMYGLLKPLNLERVNESAAKEITQLYRWLEKACELRKDIVTVTEEE